MDGVEPNSEDYPDAPVPRHERMWRHPSEMGEAIWQRTEPPLAIGRGLLITSGAIGGLLALAVLWAMLPTNAGGGASGGTTAVMPTLRAASSSTFRVGSVPASELTSSSERTTADDTTAASTRPTTTGVRSVTSTALTDPPDTAADSSNDGSADSSAPSTGPTTEDGSSTAASTTSPAGSATTTSAPAPGTGSSVVATTAPRTSDSTEGTISVTSGAAARSAIAVSVGSAPMVLTTAGAVNKDDDTVMLAYASGTTTRAKVTMIYHGIAVLAPDTADDARPFAAAAAPQTGDVVTLLSSSPTTAALTVAGDGSLQVSWGSADVAEGTPVVNAGGQLVGLCSHGSNGPKVLPVDVASLRRAVATLAGDTSSSPAWVGVQLNADPKGSLTINYVDPNGPAAEAGVVAGDTIVAIDATAMSSSQSLYDTLGTHRPDDQIALTVQHVDGSQATLDIVLAVAPASA